MEGVYLRPERRCRLRACRRVGRATKTSTGSAPGGGAGVMEMEAFVCFVYTLT